MDAATELVICYSFAFRSGKKIAYEIRLDGVTCAMIPVNHETIPGWCRLDYMQCTNCTKTKEDSIYCPLAVNAMDIIDRFKAVFSYETVAVTVTTRERRYRKDGISVQEALGSLLGIIMVASGCADLDKLRPMVRFHLPFASLEETLYRHVSMYQLAQYLRYKQGLKPDWDMAGLVALYEKIHHINMDFVKRLQRATEKDANLNAVVILDSIAQMVPLGIENTLNNFAPLFTPYLED